MSRKSIFFVVLAALAVLLGTLWLGMRLGGRSAEPAAAGTQMATGRGNVSLPLPGLSAPSLPPSVAPSLSHDRSPPPWAMSPVGATGAPSSGTAGQAERQKQLDELRAMQQALMKTMQETHRADPQQTIALLDKIKEVTGSSVVGGVDMDALRKNLMAAGEIQRLAEEMGAEARKPGGGDSQKIKAYSAQLQKLQQQISPMPYVPPQPMAKTGK